MMRLWAFVGVADVLDFRSDRRSESVSNMKKWMTKGGRKIRIRDMTDPHLLNTIMMLERKHSRDVCMLYSLSGFIQGEQASLDLDSAIDRAEEGGAAESYPIYEDMVREAFKRGLIADLREVEYEPQR